MKRLPVRVQQSMLSDLRADIKNAASSNTEFVVGNDKNSGAKIRYVFGITNLFCVFLVATSVLAIIVLLYFKSFVQETRERLDTLEEDVDVLANEQKDIKTNTQINSLVQVGRNIILRCWKG